MPQNLTDITISEVSLVDAPANKGARVMLFKRDEVEKKDFSDKEREHLAGTGAAMPDGSFPIQSVADLKNAIHAYGRAKDKAKAKAHIISRARSLGATSELPEDWTKRAKVFRSDGTVGSMPSPTFKFNAALCSPVAKDGDGDGEATLFNDAISAGDAREYAEPICEEIQEANRALYDSICSIIDDDTVADKQAMLAQTFEQYKECIGSLSTDIEKATTNAMAIALASGRNPSSAVTALPLLQKDNTMTEQELKKKMDDAIATAVAPLNAELAKRDAEIAVLKMSEKHKGYMDRADMSDKEKSAFMSKSPDERDQHMKDNPVEKRLPADVQKRLAEADALQKRLAALEEKDELAAITKRAVEEYRLPAEFGAVLQKAERGDKEAIAKLGAKIGELTKSRDEALRVGGVFKEFGTSRGADGDAMQQLLAKRDELRKLDPSLTQEKAFAKVYADPANRDLVAQEKRERMNKMAAA